MKFQKRKREMKNKTFWKVFFLVFLALAMLGFVRLLMEIAGHVDVKVESYADVKSIILTQGGLMDILPLQAEWEPCKRLEEPFEFREKYLVYFIPDSNGFLEAQFYRKENQELVTTSRVKWSSGEEYSCFVGALRVEGAISIALGERVLVVRSGDLYLGGYPLNTTNLPQEVDYTHNEYIRTLPEGSSVIYVSEQNRFILFFPDNFKILAIGKVKP